MNIDDREDEAWVERVAATLRATPGADREGEARVMARIREEASRKASAGRGRAPAWWRWWLHPRPIALPPLVPVAAACALVALLLLWMRAETRPAASPVPVAQFATQTARTAARPVPFVCVAAEARRVSVVGDFNDWNPEANPLERSGRRGAWSGLLWLPPGVYEYAFVIDGRLQAADDARPAGPPDDFGVTNSVLIVRQESI
jgi:hypothetical protein